MRFTLAKALLAVGFLCCLPAYFLHEALFESDRVLIAADTMAPHPPWSEDWGHARNPELSDHAHSWIPWSSFVADEVVHRGRAPLWNPYQFCGSPAIGNPQFEHFDVFGLPLHAAFATVSSSLNAFEWGAWLRLSLAGLGTYLLARRLGRSRGAALLAGTIYAYGGFQVLWLLYPLAHVACWLPWVLWAIERAQQERSRLALIGVSFFLALAVLGGHPETAFFVGFASGVFALYGGLSIWRSGGGWNPLLTTLCALAAGSLLGAPALLPFLEYLGESSIDAVRADRERHDQAPTILELGLRLFAFASLLFLLIRPPHKAGVLRRVAAAAWMGLALVVLFSAPDALLYPQLLIDPQWLGDPRGEGWRGPATFLEAHTAYVGAGALVLCLCGLTTAPLGGTRTRALWASMALLALLAGRGIAPFDTWLHQIPPFSMVELTRGHVVANLALAMLAAMGMDGLLDLAFTTSSERWRRALAPATAFVVLASGIAILLPDQERSVEREIVRGDRAPSALSELPEGEAILAPLGIVRSSAAGVLIRVRTRAVETEAQAFLQPRNASAQPIEIALAPVNGAPRLREARLVHLQIPNGAYDLMVRCRDAAGERDWHGGRIYWGLQGGPLSSQGRSASLAVSMVLACALLILLSGAARRPAVRTLLTTVFLGGVLFELWVFGATWNTVCSKEPIFRSTPSLEFVRARLNDARERGDGEFRIWAATEVLPPNAASGLRLRDVRGYDAIECSRWQLLQQLLVLHPALRTGAIEAPASPSQLHVGNFPVESPLFCSLGVRYVFDRRLLPPAILAARGLRLAFPVRSDVPPLDGVYIYEAEIADGRRAFLTTHAISSAEAGMRFAAGDLALMQNPRDTLILDGDATPMPLTQPMSRGRVRFEVDDPDRVVLRLEDVDGEAWLALMDSAFPGWEAEIDGVPAPIETAQIAFRAVRVPAGAQRITFVYRPQSLSRGFVCAALGIVLALCSGWFLRRQSARP